MPLARSVQYDVAIMLRTFAALSCVASLSSFALFGAGCAAETSRAGSSESDYTSDGGDAGDDAVDAGADAAPVEVAAYADGDIAPTPKARFSYAGAEVVESPEASLSVILEGADRRFQITAASPEGRPVAYLEFGRGAPPPQVGVYDCATNEAVLLVIRDDGSKVMTAVKGGPQRSCKVTITQAVEWDRGGVAPPNAAPIYRVLGTFEGDVGPREQADGETAHLVGAFALLVH